MSCYTNNTLKHFYNQQGPKLHHGGPPGPPADSLSPVWLNTPDPPEQNYFLQSFMNQNKPRTSSCGTRPLVLSKPKDCEERASSFLGVFTSDGLCLAGESGQRGGTAVPLSPWWKERRVISHFRFINSNPHEIQLYEVFFQHHPLYKHNLLFPV